jgi:hypothetical protein
LVIESYDEQKLNKFSTLEVNLCLVNFKDLVIKKLIYKRLFIFIKLYLYAYQFKDIFILIKYLFLLKMA